MGSFLAELGVEIPQKRKRAAGMLLMALAGLSFVLADGVTQCAMQRVHEINSKLSASQVMIVRSIVTLLCSLMLMLIRGYHPLGGRGSTGNLLPFSLLGILEDLAIYFAFAALTCIPVADFKVLQFTFIVFSALFGFIFLRQRCFFLDSIFGALSFVGVVIVAQPRWLFPGMKSNSIITLSDTPTTTTITPVISPYFSSGKYLKGVLFSLGSAVSLSFYFVMNSYVGQSLPTVLNVFYPSVYGILIPPFVMLALGEKFLFTELDSIGWAMLVLVGLLYFLAMMCLSESYQLESVGPATLIRGLDIVYASVIQVVLIKVGVTWNVIVGAAIILLTTSVLVLNRWMDIYNWITQKLCPSKKYERIQDSDEQEETK